MMTIFSSQLQKRKIIDYGIYSRYQLAEHFAHLPKKKLTHAHKVRTFHFQGRIQDCMNGLGGVGVVISCLGEFVAGELACGRIGRRY